MTTPKTEATPTEARRMAEEIAKNWANPPAMKGEMARCLERYLIEYGNGRLEDAGAFLEDRADTWLRQGDDIARQIAQVSAGYCNHVRALKEKTSP